MLLFSHFSYFIYPVTFILVPLLPFDDSPQHVDITCSYSAKASCSHGNTFPPS